MSVHEHQMVPDHAIPPYAWHYKCSVEGCDYETDSFQIPTIEAVLPPTEGCTSCASAYAEITRLRADIEQLIKERDMAVEGWKMWQDKAEKAEAVVRAAEDYRKAEIAYAQTVLDSPTHEDDLTRKEWGVESLARSRLDDLLAAYRERAI